MDRNFTPSRQRRQCPEVPCRLEAPLDRRAPHERRETKRELAEHALDLKKHNDLKQPYNWGASGPKGPLAGHDDDLVGIDVAIAITGLSRATIYRKIKDPEDDLPRPLDISLHRRKFLLGELRSWRARRLAERDAPAVTPERAAAPATADTVNESRDRPEQLRGALARSNGPPWFDNQCLPPRVHRAGGGDVRHL